MQEIQSAIEARTTCYSAAVVDILKIVLKTRKPS